VGIDIYRGQDPLEMPRYSIADAARFLSIPLATVRSWTWGRSYPSIQGARRFPPLIQADKDGLSFLNLVELHVLRALRETHAVKVKSVRIALNYAENELGIKRLLLREELLTGGGDLFIECYGHLLTLSRHGQLALKELLKRYLQRIDRDDARIPIRLYPLVTGLDDERHVVIDPRVAFGKPTLKGTGIRTSMIVTRIDAGESIAGIAADYDIAPVLVTSALLYEKAA